MGIFPEEIAQYFPGVPSPCELCKRTASDSRPSMHHNEYGLWPGFTPNPAPVSSNFIGCLCE